MSGTYKFVAVCYLLWLLPAQGAKRPFFPVYVLEIPLVRTPEQPVQVTQEAKPADTRQQGQQKDLMETNKEHVMQNPDMSLNEVEIPANLAETTDANPPEDLVEEQKQEENALKKSEPAARETQGSTSAERNKYGVSGDITVQKFCETLSTFLARNTQYKIADEADIAQLEEEAKAHPVQDSSLCRETANNIKGIPADIRFIYVQKGDTLARVFSSFYESPTEYEELKDLTTSHIEEERATVYGPASTSLYDPKTYSERGGLESANLQQAAEDALYINVLQWDLNESCFKEYQVTKYQITKDGDGRRYTVTIYPEWVLKLALASRFVEMKVGWELPGVVLGSLLLAGVGVVGYKLYKRLKMSKKNRRRTLDRSFASTSLR